MALESVTLDGVILLRASSDCNGEPALFSLIRPSSNTFILSLRGRRKALQRRYPSKVTDSTPFCYYSSSSSVDSVVRDVSSVVSSASSSRGGICIVDGVDVLVAMWGADRAAALLHRLNAAPGSCVAAVCPQQSVGESAWMRLAAVADATFSLYKDHGICLSRSLIYKKNGKTINMTESVSVTRDLKLTSRKFEQQSIEDRIGGSAPADDGTQDISRTQFDMGLTLKESERSAKDALQLPYMSMQNQEGLVSLRLSEKKVRVGGQVIYTPDEGDDLDDSDPDDDLNL